MAIVRADDIKITFDCEDCGPTELVLSDGHAGDSIASCGSCGGEFGRWAAIRSRAKMETAIDATAIVLRPTKH